MAGLLASLTVLVTVAPARGADLDAYAARQLHELAQYDGTDRSREALERNLQDYFAVYKTPTDPDELARLVRALEQIELEFLGELYEAAVGRARAAGREAIAAADVAAAAGARLPSRPDEAGDLIYFPDLAPAERTRVETVDLDALRDIGLPWETLRAFVARPDGIPVPVDEDAIEPLATALSAHALLVLRLGGEAARQGMAPHLAPHHLRAAVKEIDRRAAAPPAATQPPPPPTPAGERWFKDVTEEAGIAFRHRTSDWLARYRRYGGRYPTFSGGGATAVDLDGDGWADLIFCGGDGCAVFRNRHDGTFADISAASGLVHPGEARMALVADLDNDGVRDVFLGYVRDTNRLYRGLGDGRFADVTAASGLEREGEIFGGAVVFDYDGDGLLDLFVANFGNYLAKDSPWLTRNAQNGMPSRLFHNEGGLRFRDVTAASGIEDTGWTQAVSHFDYDLDGDQDLLLANDYGRNSLWVNEGGGRFVSRGRETFLDNPFHGMNVSFADLNGDLHPEIFVSNIWTLNPASRRLVEFNTLFESRVVREGDIRYSYGHMAELSQDDTGWSWGAAFLDADNDGDDDLYCANGLNPYFTFFLERPHPEREGATYPYNFDRLPNLLYENRDGAFVRVPAAGGAEVVDANSRSVARLDFDHDGDLDLAVSTFHSHPRLFRNEAAPPDHHWLEVTLTGDPSAGSSPEAIGSQVIARTADGGYAWRIVTGGEGYLAQGDPPVGIGLGAATTVDLEVIWPGGRRQRFEGIAADRAIHLTEGSPEVEVLWTGGSR